MSHPPRMIVIDEGQARIPLTKGLWATFDLADAELVTKYTWRAHIDHKAGRAYAKTSGVGPDGVHSDNILMHRLLAGAVAGEIVKHRDNDGLNNRRANLQVKPQAANLDQANQARREAGQLKHALT